MKPEVPKWVAKAEGDFLTAQREYRARKSPNYDSAYAVDFRYPGEFASKEDATESLNTCRELRRMARQSLGLPE